MSQKSNLNVQQFITEFHAATLLHSLSVDEVNLLLEQSRIDTVDEGDQLVYAGDKVTHLLFILEGSLVTFRCNTHGEEVNIRLLGKGQCCMDAVIFMGSESPIGVKAASAGQVLKIPAQTVKQPTESNVVFANNIIAVLADFYKESILQLDNISIKASKERVGYYLLRAFLAGNQDDDHFSLKFKKAVIAHYLGMTPEIFSRMLKEMQKKDQLITVKGAEITLMHSKSLCQFCDDTTKNVCTKKEEKDCHLLP